MNSGSSASIDSGSQDADALAVASWYQTSRFSSQSILPPVRFTTTQVWVQSQPESALSALALSGMLLPPRTPSSAVITAQASASRMRSFSASGEKPPNTTECTAPIRAQASMAYAASGIIGM